MATTVIKGEDQAQAEAQPRVSIRERGYAYPNGLDLRPDSHLHGQVLQKIMARGEESFRVMQERHSAWAKTDQVMRGYIPLSAYERELKRKGGNEGEMHYSNRPVSIIVPHSYAVRDTLLTYLMEAFLSAPPFQYDGGGPEDTIGAKLLELVVDSQVRYSRAGLNIITAVNDGLTYGLGPATVEWVTKWGRRSVVSQRPVFGLAGELLGYEPVRQNVDALLFEGNRMHNIDPYRYLPDPNVAAENIQDGEYVGWVLPVSYYKLAAQEKADPSMFNVRHLKERQDQGGAYGGGSPSKLVSTNAERVTDAGAGSQGFKTSETKYHEILTMFIELIPKDWGLGDLEAPEIWHFTVADDTVILRAQPLDMNHREFPVAVAVPDHDGYSATPVSRMEIIQGLQDVLNWLFNSHIANVRKAINDMLIVDPSLVHLKDLEDPNPGKLVKLRRSAWGRGVDNAVKQLMVNDVTRTNMADVPGIVEMMQRASGAVDSVQGIMRAGGERRSAAESRMTGGNALSRLERMARTIAMQLINPMSMFYASNTQQYMSRGVYLKAAGSWPEELAREYGVAGGVQVSPFDLMVNFDIIPKDGTTPTSGAANADILQMMFQSVSGDPELRQVFDVPRIFVSLARKLGEKNAFDFVRKGGQIASQVLPDEAVLAQAQAGNAVPLDEIRMAA